MPWKKRDPDWRVKKLPRNLFGTVIGYNDVKQLFKDSIRTREQTHILLAGPPASAKTIFLLECNRLQRSYYLMGSKVTKAGLVEVLFEESPSYLLVDEVEKMNREARSVLLGLMDPGIVTDVKYPYSRAKELKTNVYGACNEFDALIPELLSRFHFKLQFEAYSYEEFIQVGTRVLTMLEGTDPRIAEYIVRRVAQYSRDIRTTIGIARLAKSLEDVDELTTVQQKYMPYSRNDRFLYPP